MPRQASWSMQRRTASGFITAPREQSTIAPQEAKCRLWRTDRAVLPSRTQRLSRKKPRVSAFSSCASIQAAPPASVTQSPSPAETSTANGSFTPVTRWTRARAFSIDSDENMACPPSGNVGTAGPKPRLGTLSPDSLFASLTLQHAGIDPSLVLLYRSICDCTTIRFQTGGNMV